MAQKITINANAVDDLLALYGAGAVIRLERSLVESSGYTEIDDIALVSGTTQYAIWDGSGGESHWYRSRFTSTSGGSSSTYTAPFRAGSLLAYASMDDLIERINLPDETRYNQLSDHLVGAARYLDTRIGFDFFRHPQVSGDETRLFDVDAMRVARLPIYGGIVSATSVSVGATTGDTLTLLDATDWYLYPRQLEPEGTYTHIALGAVGSWERWYRGQAVVSVTGAFGWSAPPTIVSEANLALAARWFHEWQTKHAGPVGNPEFGTVNLVPNLPDVVYRAIEAFRRYWWLAA